MCFSEPVVSGTRSIEAKDAEILALRHRIEVLHRQRGKARLKRPAGPGATFQALRDVDNPLTTSGEPERSGSRTCTSTELRAWWSTGPGNGLIDKRPLHPRSGNRESANALIRRLITSTRQGQSGTWTTVLKPSNASKRTPSPSIRWKRTPWLEPICGGRGTRTHKPLRATVFKCVAGRPDWPCLLLPDAIHAGQRQDTFLIGTGPPRFFLARSLTQR